MFQVSARLFAALSAAALASVAFGQGAEPLPPQDVPYNPSADQPGWYWGGPNDALRPDTGVPVALDPNGDPIQKLLFEPPQPGLPFVLHETIEIVPPSDPATPVIPWADWHEEIHTPGWEWGSGTIMRGGMSDPLPGLDVQIMGPTIWFFFDPIDPGPDPAGRPVTITIWKELVFTGDPGTAPQYPIDIWEYPTPEPASLLLLLGGGLFALRRR